MGILFYNTLTGNLTEDKKNEISSLMQIKKNQVLNWLEERKSEARYFSTNDFFIDDIYKYGNKKTPEIKASLQSRVLTVQKNHYSRVTVVSSRGEELISVGEVTFRKLDKIKIDSTIKVRKSWMDDLILDKETGLIHLDLYAPLVKRIGNQDSVIAVMIFTVNPYDNLYPIVQSWPIHTESAEALLVKKIDDKIVTLVDLKGRPNSALRFEVSMQDDDLPGVKAIKGYQGTYEAVDYRNQKVLASAGIIPGTNWYLLIKIDQQEVYRPVYLYAAFITIIIIVLIIATGTSIASFARRRELDSFQKQYQLEQEKLALKEHYEYLIKYANDIILLMDYLGRIIDVNDKAVTEYGYSRDELLAMNISDLRSPYIKDKIKSLLSPSNEEGFIYESVHRKKNGEEFNIEVSSRIIEVNKRKFVQNIIRDITERKINERKIQRLNRVYAILSQVDEVIIRESDESKLFQQFCNISLETGQFIAVGIGILNEKSSFLEIVASAGFNGDYFSRLKISINEGEYGKGPTSKVLREGKYSVVNDIENNPSMELWKDDALKRGYKSAGSFPLKNEVKTFGAIMFYSADKDFFDEEEIRLLNELANDLSYAIENMEKEKKTRAAEEALQKTQLNLKTLARSIPKTNIYIFNSDLEIILAEGENQESGIINLYEIIKREINGQNSLKINLKEKILSVFADNVHSDEVNIGDLTYLIQLNPVKNDSGGIIAGMIVLQNITETKKIQSALLASESQLKGFFNLNNVYMALMELKKDDVCIIMANKKIAEFYNIDVEELRNKSLLELEGNDFYNYWIDIYKNIKKYKRPVSIEFSVNRGENVKWFVADISLIEPRDGENTLFSYTAFDITERKTIENDLKKSEERFRSFFDSDVIALAYGDIYGNIRYANNEYLNIIGYSREDFNEGKINWRKLTPPEFIPQDERKFEVAREKGHCDTYEKELFKKDGSRVRIEVGFVLSGENMEEVTAFIHKIA